MKYINIYLKDIDTGADDFISLEFGDDNFYLDVYNRLVMTLRGIDLITNPFLIIEDSKRSYVINAENVLYIEMDN